MLQTSHADGTVVTHAYDIDGNRVQTGLTPPGGTPEITNYLIDPRGVFSSSPRATGLTEPPNDTETGESGSRRPMALSHVVAETDATGTLLAHYVRGGDELLSVIRPIGTRFYHLDGLGSVRRLTDETGAITDAYQYNAFGELLEHVGSDPNPYQFAGERIGPLGRFTYNRARWLYPTVGRFLSIDPFEGFMEAPETLHRYSYASNDPVNLTDPTGEFSYSQAFVSQALGNILLTLGAAYLANQELNKLKDQQILELAEQGCLTIRQLEKHMRVIPKEKKWKHHLIEKRLLEESQVLQDMFDNDKENIPGVPLIKAHHEAYRKYWRDDRCGFRQRKSVKDPSRNFGIEEIILAAAWVYTRDEKIKDENGNEENTYHPEYVNALFGCN